MKKQFLYLVFFSFVRPDENSFNNTKTSNVTGNTSLAVCRDVDCLQDAPTTLNNVNSKEVNKDISLSQFVPDTKLNINVLNTTKTNITNTTLNSSSSIHTPSNNKIAVLNDLVKNENITKKIGININSRSSRCKQNKPNAIKHISNNRPSINKYGISRKP